jgi:Protein of unknown function (DUF559)
VGPGTTNNPKYEGPRRDERILRAARHNVITTDELRCIGLTDGDIAYRVAARRLHRKHRKVFAVGRPDLSLDGVFLAAVLACGPKAVLSHASALRKWGLRGGGTYRIDVTAPRQIKPKPGIRLHRPLSLDALDTTIVDGIPITSVAQTLLDVAAPMHRIDIGQLLHESNVAELLDMRAIWAVLARQPNHSGARRLDWASREEVPFTRSDLERTALALFRSFRVPTPACNQWIWDGAKLVEVDFVWRELGLIVEVDGSRYHRTRWRRRRDDAKTTALRAQGWTVLRFSDVEINGTPAQVATTTLTAMRGPLYFG